MAEEADGIARVRKDLEGWPALDGEYRLVGGRGRGEGWRAMEHQHQRERARQRAAQGQSEPHRKTRSPAPLDIGQGFGQDGSAEAVGSGARIGERAAALRAAG